MTETALFDNLAPARSIAGSLQDQGIRLALDDFGSGYSIAHLHVTAIKRLGDNMGLPITADAIEDARAKERLRTLSCGEGLGCLYGHPTSIANIRSLLAERWLLRPAATVSSDGTVKQRRAS